MAAPPGIELAVDAGEEIANPSHDVLDVVEVKRGRGEPKAKNYIDNLSGENRKVMTEKAEQGIWPS